MTLRLNPLLRQWREIHRDLCPACRGRDEPSHQCARIWAREWLARQNPISPSTEEVEDALRQERKDHAEALAGAGALCAQFQRRAEVAEAEVERLRRENARLLDDLGEFRRLH